MHKRRRSVTYDMWRRRKTRTYLLTYKHNTQVGAQPSTAPVNATLLAFCVQHRSTLQIELDRYLLPWGALQQTRRTLLQRSTGQTDRRMDTRPLQGSLQASSDSSPVSERPYLSEQCIPVSSADTRRHLRSANRHQLAVPRFWLDTYGRRAFSVAGPMAWNSLPGFIWDPKSSTDCFRHLLKTYLFARY